MTDYASLKVPELKKLLAENGLAHTGNKADLIARLVENDTKKQQQQQDEETKQQEEKVEEPVAEVKSAEKTEAKEDEITYSDDEKNSAPASAEQPKDQSAAAASAPQSTFSMGLDDSSATLEAQKRASRAKRFGLEADTAGAKEDDGTVNAADEAKKRAERAAKFGIDEERLVSGLDAALPERGMKRKGGDGWRGGKRRRGGGGGGGRRDGQHGGQRRDGQHGGGRRNGGGGGGGGVLNDPSEKAKAERRAARFAAA